MVGAEANAAVLDDAVKEAAMATLPLLLPFMIDNTVASISTADDDDGELIVIIDRDRLPFRLLVDDISLAVAGADAEAMVCQCI